MFLIYWEIFSSLHETEYDSSETLDETTVLCHSGLRC